MISYTWDNYEYTGNDNKTAPDEYDVLVFFGGLIIFTVPLIPVWYYFRRRLLNKYKSLEAKMLAIREEKNGNTNQDNVEMETNDKQPLHTKTGLKYMAIDDV